MASALHTRTSRAWFLANGGADQEHRPGWVVTVHSAGAMGLTWSRVGDRSDGYGTDCVQVLVFTVTVVSIATVTPRSVAPVQLVDVRMAPGAVAVQSRPAN